MKLAGVTPPPYSNAAHHIVAVSASRAQRARDILEQYGIFLVENSIICCKLKRKMI